MNEFVSTVFGGELSARGVMVGWSTICVLLLADNIRLRIKAILKGKK